MEPLSDYLSQLNKLSKREEKKAFLENIPPRYAFATKAVLWYMFSTKVKFALPEGPPPYTPSRDDGPGVLLAEIQKMYLYLDPATGGHPGLKQIKREKLWVDLLEKVHPRDALLLIAMKDKKSPWKGVDRKLVEEIHPDLFEAAA